MNPTDKTPVPASPKVSISFTIDRDLLEWIDRAAEVAFDGSRAEAICAFLRTHFELFTGRNP